jgi:hypothetical protein
MNVIIIADVLGCYTGDAQYRRGTTIAPLVQKVSKKSSERRVFAGGGAVNRPSC